MQLDVTQHTMCVNERARKDRGFWCFGEWKRFFYTHELKLSVHIKLVERNILISSHYHFVCSSFLLHLTFNISCMHTCVCACVSRIESKNHPTILLTEFYARNFTKENASILGAVERKTSRCFVFELANGHWQTPSREWMECYRILVYQWMGILNKTNMKCEIELNRILLFYYYRRKSIFSMLW